MITQRSTPHRCAFKSPKSTPIPLKESRPTTLELGAVSRFKATVEFALARPDLAEVFVTGRRIEHGRPELHAVRRVLERGDRANRLYGG